MTSIIKQQYRKKQPIEDIMKNTIINLKVGTALIVGLTMATLSTGVQAEDEFDGIYAGINMGYEKAKTSINIGTLDTSSDGTENYSFLVGYREQLFDSLVLGIEASFTKNKSKNFALLTLADTTVSQLDYERKNPFSVNVMAGIPVGDRALLFGTLGYSQVKSKLGLASSTSQSGYEFGVGLEVNVFGPLHLRGTAVSYNAGSTTDEDPLSDFTNTKFKAKGYRFMVGAIFQF